jgi:hypothetical protein
MKNFKLDKDQMNDLEKFSDMATSVMFKMVGWISRMITFFSKNKKLLYGIILIFILFKVGTYVVAIEPTGVYEITTSSGVVYTTNKFEVKDGCVYFDRIKDGQQIIICGGASIVKSK